MRLARGWKPLLLAVASMALVAAFGAGCSKDDNNQNPVSPQFGTVSVHFDNQVDGTAAVIDISRYDYTNAAGNNYSISRLRYFVSDLTLHRTDGATFGIDGYHYRDADDATTRTWTLDGVPTGTYDAISFTFGLPADKNKSGSPIADDPATQGMEWPPGWGGGWHYMILEGNYKETGTGDPYGYRTHMGRRFVSNGDGMPPGPDEYPYEHTFRKVLTLPQPFTVGGNDKWEIRAIMNINGWYNNPQIDLEAWFPQGVGGIMVMEPAQEMLQANGPSCFTVSSAVKQ